MANMQGPNQIAPKFSAQAKIDKAAIEGQAHVLVGDPTKIADGDPNPYTAVYMPPPDDPNNPGVFKHSGNPNDYTFVQAGYPSQHTPREATMTGRDKKNIVNDINEANQTAHAAIAQECGYSAEIAQAKYGGFSATYSNNGQPLSGEQSKNVRERLDEKMPEELAKNKGENDYQATKNNQEAERLEKEQKEKEQKEKEQKAEADKKAEADAEKKEETSTTTTPTPGMNPS